MEQFTDLKKDILVDNALDWKKFKILVTVCCSYMASPALTCMHCMHVY